MVDSIAIHKTAKVNGINIHDQIKDNERPDRIFHVNRIEGEFVYAGPCKNSTICETKISLHRIYTDGKDRKTEWSLIKLDK